MKNIATHDLRKADIPPLKFDWSTFSQFALTFDPLSEAKDGFDHVPASATPSDKWTLVSLRYYLYCWQRIGNNQEGLRPEEIDKIEITLNILRQKF